MQGKGVVKFFAILLAIVCLYQLSFTWVAHSVEKKAELYAKGDTTKEKAYLDSVSALQAYPILGHTYQYCVDRELALGLDLKGGMNVTMQISLVELVKTLSGNSTDPTFNQALANANADVQKGSQTDYITLFVNEYEKLNPNGKLATIFSTKDNQTKLKFNASNSEVEAYLKDQASTAVQQSYTVLSRRIDQFGVVQPNIQLQKNTNRIVIDLPGVKDQDRVRKLLQGSAKLEFYKTFENQEAYPVLASLDKLLAASKKDTSKKAASNATTAKKDTGAAKGGLALLNKVQKSASKDSTSALTAKTQDEHPLASIVQFNYYKDPQSGQTQLVPGPIVGFALQKDTAKINGYLHSAEAKSVVPQNMRFLWSVKPHDGTKVFDLYVMKLSGANNGPALEGDVITDARPDIDQTKGQPDVVMVMNSQGAEKWRVITAEAAAVKGAIAIVLDDNVYSAPVPQGEISGGVSSITGNYKQEETADLANVLKAGRLETPARIVSSAVVGPSLGEQSINDSLMSCVMGLIVVLVFMIAYYNRAGTVAVVAVVINVFFLMGVLTSLRAVLTVPGVAGIVLTLGIAVDANVLIYERVREEMALGKSIRLAISDGFKHALWSILDSNISTFLTGAILFAFGSGPIQGFATTLMIGIVTSLFCSLLISRLIFEWMLTKGWDIKFSNPWSSHTFKNANYKFVKNRYKFYAFSGIFIIAGLISMFTQNFNYGVDFQGGRSYLIQFENKIATPEDVRQAVDLAMGHGNEVKTLGDKIQITTNYMIDDNSPNADNIVQNKLISALNAKAVTHMTAKDILSSNKVEATIAAGLKQSAIWTVIAAILIISAYILLRFRKWQFSLGAMVATAHDALMVLSFFSIFKNILPFSNFVVIDQAFIAAILTVIGYSINDTVVVFDRIREFLANHHAKTDDQNEVINNAINNTLSRTIITALTVLFVLIVLFIFGGDVIRSFSFALLIGVCFGTYSSICIATPVIVDFGKKDLR